MSSLLLNEEKNIGGGGWEEKSSCLLNVIVIPTKELSASFTVKTKKCQLYVGSREKIHRIARVSRICPLRNMDVCTVHPVTLEQPSRRTERNWKILMCVFYTSFIILTTLLLLLPSIVLVNALVEFLTSYVFSNTYKAHWFERWYINKVWLLDWLAQRFIAIHPSTAARFYQSGRKWCTSRLTLPPCQCHV